MYEKLQLWLLHLESKRPGNLECIGEERKALGMQGRVIDKQTKRMPPFIENVFLAD